jgi:hypothetical protein
MVDLTVLDGPSCSQCHHTLVDNLHGPDQNDMFDRVCTYCKECNPRLKGMTDWA